jgi:hypothetical protein
MPRRESCDELPMFSIADRITSRYERFCGWAREELGVFHRRPILVKRFTSHVDGIYRVMDSSANLNSNLETPIMMLGPSANQGAFCSLSVKAVATTNQWRQRPDLDHYFGTSTSDCSL